MSEEQVRVISIKNGRVSWFAPHLANDKKYMNSVGFYKSELIQEEKISEVKPKHPEEIVEDIPTLDSIEDVSEVKQKRKYNKKQ